MDATRKVKVSGGPLDGKTVVVHETQQTFTHHADQDGSYLVNQKAATWKPKTKAKDQGEGQAE